VTTALATKQDSLVSGTNIKTINSTSVLGSGDIAVQETLVSGVSLKTVNSTSLLGSGDIPIPIVTPSGVSGAIQFSNGSAFASDAANLFWDDTNNRLGVGTNAPTEIVQIVRNAAVNNRVLISNSNTTATTARATLEVKVGASMTGTFSAIQGTGVYVGSTSSDRVLFTVGGTPQTNIQLNGNSNFGNSVNDLGARLGIKGSGSTSATTSLLVQNSGGNTALQVLDDRTTQASRIKIAGGGSDFDNFSALLYGTGNSLFHIQGGVGNVHLNMSGGTASNASVIVAADVVQQTTYNSAIFEVRSTTKGFLPPRMTTTQRDAIASPATGLVVYDSTTNKLQCYNGSTWNDLF
jgi:hypothetical protein